VQDKEAAYNAATQSYACTNQLYMIATLCFGGLDESEALESENADLEKSSNQ